jgi:tetratricopeptide (TPR) repeat protein
MNGNFDGPIPEDDPIILVREGHQLWEEGQQERAIAIFKKAERINPEYTRAWINLTLGQNILNPTPKEISVREKPQKRSKIDLTKAAINICDKLIELDSNNYLAWYLEGDALLKIKQYREAIACYKKAISIDPFLSSGWPARVMKLKNMQLKTEAIELCSAVFYALKQKVDDSSQLNSYTRKKFNKTRIKLEEILLNFKQE